MTGAGTKKGPSEMLANDKKAEMLRKQAMKLFFEEDLQKLPLAKFIEDRNIIIKATAFSAFSIIIYLMGMIFMSSVLVFMFAQQNYYPLTAQNLLRMALATVWAIVFLKALHYGIMWHSYRIASVETANIFLKLKMKSMGRHPQDEKEQ